MMYISWPPCRDPRVTSPRLAARWTATLATLLLGAAAPLCAQDLEAQGPEFRVNTSTTGRQGTAAVSADADGDFVVVWDSPGQDGTPTYGIFGQRYQSSGAPLGAEFRIN